MDMDDAAARARSIAEDVVRRHSEQTDREARWPEESIRALLGAGLGGMVLPREHGGLGLGLAALARVCEELGRVCPSTALCFGMHHVAAAVISAKASPAQAERYLAPIATGQHLTTLALSEPGTGVNFYFPETALRDTADGYLVRGTKSFVTNGGHADSYVVSTAPRQGAPPGEFSLVVIPREAEGLAWQGAWAGWGMRGNSSRSVELRDVHVPRRDLLGREGDELWYVFQVVTPYFLIAMSGTYVGIARAALEEARESLRARTYSHSGASPSSVGVLQHRLGVMWGEVERSRQLVHHAARLGDAGSDDALLALCGAKAEIADCAVSVANEAMTLVGGRGYASESRLTRLLRDARAAHVMAPTTDTLRTWMGRALLDLPILSD
ncbi:MAG: acyl-CoA/acyl-ACP dehydrogenase [Myxococcota bacterium]|nr:acyl-CoA/acyl-ACP dehydrogenase [Myxococcota bacterium]